MSQGVFRARRGLRWLRQGRGIHWALAAGAVLLSACATVTTNGAASGEPTAGAPTPQAGQPAPRAGQAEPQAPPEPDLGLRLAGTRRPGAGLFSPLATLGYIPLKMVPCSLGAVGSILGFLFTFDARMVRDTITLNCGGDWVITPGMLEGDEYFRSQGRVEDLRGPSPPAPPPPAAAIPPLGDQPAD